MRPHLLLTVLSCAVLVGCSHHRLHAPSNFAVLDEDSSYATRAVSAEGVVLGVREIDNSPRASADFWLSAIRTQLTDGRGYALLDSRDIKAKSGQRGKQLRMGRDQNGEQYLYWLSLFVTQKRIYIVETGGRQDRFLKAQKELEGALERLELDGTEL